MDFKKYLIKLQNLPDSQKKIILWTAVGILAVVMGFFWINWTISDLSKLNVNLQLPQISSPVLDTVKNIQVQK